MTRIVQKRKIISEVPVVYCDRCDAEICIGPINPTGPSSHWQQAFNIGDSSNFDLCDVCSIELADWLVHWNTHPEQP